MGAQEFARLNLLAALGQAAAIEPMLPGINDRAMLDGPLRTAAAAGHSNVVELLLGEGANVHATVEGVTPMGLACANGRIGTIRLLLSYGVDFRGLGFRGAWWLADFVGSMLDSYEHLCTERDNLLAAVSEAQQERQQLMAVVGAQQAEMDALRALVRQLQAGGAG